MSSKTIGSCGCLGSISGYCLDCCRVGLLLLVVHLLISLRLALILEGSSLVWFSIVCLLVILFDCLNCDKYRVRLKTRPTLQFRPLITFNRLERVEQTNIVGRPSQFMSRGRGTWSVAQVELRNQNNNISLLFRILLLSRTC